MKYLFFVLFFISFSANSQSNVLTYNISDYDENISRVEAFALEFIKTYPLKLNYDVNGHSVIFYSNGYKVIELIPLIQDYELIFYEETSYVALPLRINKSLAFLSLVRNK
jgi:predicted P-loop ATPase/GTPase